jgi:NAD(P)-dependent dehydrogenase (short-subunit alcohol dehydrogenase family)
LAVGALLTVLVLRPSRAVGSGGAPEDVAPPFASGGGSSAQALDISQMTPEERAQRLFDRVMRLGEEGKTDSLRFFMPMALGAYQQLPALSLDSHFDIGLLHLAAGDPASALTEADTIRRSVPTHLFGFVLRARALQAQGNTGAAAQAFRDFLKNEQAERARSRPEYEEHGRILDAFHSEAVAAPQAGGRSP